MAGQRIRSLKDLRMPLCSPRLQLDHNETLRAPFEVIIALSLCFQNDNENGTSDPDQKAEQVVVQIELLKPKDQFVSLYDALKENKELSQP